MEITRVSELRPRFVWDILDDAFDLYREQFAVLCGIAAVSFLPTSILTIALNTTGTSGSHSKDSFWAFVGPLFISIPLFFATSLLEACAIAIAVRDRFEGRTTTIGSAYRRALRRPFTLLGAALLIAFLSIVGLIPMGLGTLVVMLWAAFLAQALVLEERSLASAWRRTRDLTSNEWPKVLGVLVLIYGMISVLQIGLTFLIQGVFYLLPAQGADAGARAAQQDFLSQTAGNLAHLILAPLVSISLTLLYMDLRVRREGIDMVALAEERDLPLAPDPFGDKSSFRVVREQQHQRRRPRRAASGSPSQ